MVFEWLDSVHSATILAKFADLWPVWLDPKYTLNKQTNEVCSLWDS